MSSKPIAKYLVAGSLIVGVVIVLRALVFGSAPQAGPRTTYASRPLDELVRPDDTDVTVTSKYERPLLAGRRQSEAETIAGLLSSGAGAIVIRIDRGQGELTETHDWVRTRWSGEVVQVLRQPPSHPMAIGSTFGFRRETGDLKVKQANVHARLDRLREPLAGTRYLVFAAWDPQTGALRETFIGSLDMYRILATGVLETAVIPLSTSNPGDPLDGKPFSEVAGQIQAWVAANDK